jgi:hypothetical protein
MISPPMVKNTTVSGVGSFAKFPLPPESKSMSASETSSNSTP